MYRYAVLLLASWMLTAQTDTEWLNRGVQAFKNAHYTEAAEAFARAVEINPGSVTARLYLGTAYMQQYIPGAESPENVAHADRAMAEFQRALNLEPGNKVALTSIASLELNRKRYEEARSWYKRLLVIDPSDKTAYYSIGFTIWAQWYPAYGQARMKAGMRMETPGPIPDPAVRDSLRAQWWTALDEGIFNLKRALDLDPDYSDAMAYLNLFLRERADLLATKAEYEREVAEADLWVQRTLESKKRHAARVQGGFLTASPPPSPPPPPPGAGGPAPQRIKVGSNVQAARLVTRVNPVYPALARQAQIEGVVRFTATIGKDGRIAHLQVNSGHPMLVPAAVEAVRQWVYQPTLLNGEPVEVITDVDVHFSLAN
jgi:TonB family protein